MWLKDSVGRPSATLTFMFLSFFVVSLCIVLPMFNGLVIGGFTFNIAKPDNALIIALLAAFVPAYVIRRNSADKLVDTTETKEGKDV
jgi:hypothetical protein